MPAAPSPSVMRSFLLPYLLLTIVAAGVLMVIYTGQRASRLTVLEGGETRVTSSSQEALAVRLRAITSDIRSLAWRDELRRFLETGDAPIVAPSLRSPAAAARCRSRSDEVRRRRRSDVMPTRTSSAA